MATGLPAHAQAVSESDLEQSQQICGQYGKRFIFITFAQTCVSMDGYLRVEYVQTENHKSASSGQARYRARINLHERKETEFGLYTTEFRMQADGRSDTGAEVVFKRALLGLGGFRFGHTDTFFETHHKEGWQLAGNDGYYSARPVNLLDYTYKTGDFAFTFGLQQISGAPKPAQIGQVHADFYAGAAYQQDWGRFAGSLAYDGEYDSLMVKTSLEVNVTDALFLHAWYAQSDGETQLIYGNYSPTSTNGINTRWEWGVDVTYKVSDKLSLWTGFTDADNPSSALDADLWRVGFGAHWYITPNFSARPEVIIAGEFEQYRLQFLRSF